MRYNAAILILVLASCGGSLSSDERKRLQEESRKHEIKQVTEAEIAEAALEKGRSITEIAKDLPRDEARLDSLGRAEGATIRWRVPGASDALAVEQQIIDAYVMNPTADMPDNVQELGTDSVLYSRPEVSLLPDGAVAVEGVWSVRLSKKELILEMD
jgi:hypothetical protein